MQSVLLRPGVNTQYSYSLNEAGVSQSQLIRYDGGLIQSYGGWESFVGTTITSTVRDLHPFKGLTDVKYLGIGATAQLAVYNTGTETIADITPQTATTNPTPNFSITSGSCLVTVVDSNGYSSIYNTVYFNTPISLSGQLLNGAYPIVSALSTGSYTIRATFTATATTSNAGTLPVFDSTNGSALVTVTLPGNGFLDVTGLFYQFIAPTSLAGQTIEGPYQINTIIDSTSFTIGLTQSASATATATMNASLAQLVYYVTLGPQPGGSGFGGGGFGSGGFGTGSAVIGEPGTPITSSDWTQDNWGEALISCPEDGPLYVWSPNSGYTNTQVISQAPFFNGGCFVAMPQQILVAWRSTQTTGVQDPLQVNWSDSEDYANWTVSNQTSAGGFRIPTGSEIIGGMQAPTQGLIWTDLDVWSMQYVGGDAVFRFNRIGAGCGLIGKHAAGTLNGEVFWCGEQSFFRLSGQGVVPIQCSVWDFIFQNMNTTYKSKVVCATNSLFNEVCWFFPSANATECDSYVKYDLLDNAWDYGTLTRTAWCDQSTIGNPIGADTAVVLWEQDIGTTITGASMPSFQTGWWAIADGNEMAFVDWVLPDFIWGQWTDRDAATLSVTFYAVDYPGDTPRSYGPYTVTQATQYINTRIRGRLMAMLVQSASQSFWRIARVRYRFASSGRR